ncbi:YdcF family protein [uncultured Chryseobacterium sp.]|uniref:YdcF family protein n=1 Tax=uncultured Chryseobacterium sp. TaxID=259322 RepID=UPI0025EE0D1A|nr:YdcF family protein [uncultured Chryseobacterium sp.]
MGKRFFRLFKIISGLLFLWFTVHSIYLIADGVSDEGKRADLAVILGNKVNEDGTLSMRLEKRLESGIQLYKNCRVRRILVSGGLGKEGFYEGDKMKEFLVSEGIPDSGIIVDNKGDNTRKTVENTLELRPELQFNSIIVVSQYFHVTRTKKLFREKGFQEVSSVSPDYFEWRDLYALLREFPAYYTQ